MKMTLEARIRKYISRLRIITKVWCAISFAACMGFTVYLFIRKKIEIQEDDSQLEDKLAAFQQMHHRDLHVMEALWCSLCLSMILVFILFGLRLRLKRVSAMKTAAAE